MRNDEAMSEKESDTRSRLAQLLHDQEIVLGGVCVIARKCGKPECKCMRKGKGHASLYLNCRYQGKRKKIFIPKKAEQRAKEASKHYRNMKRMLDVISDASIERLLKRESCEPA